MQMPIKSKRLDAVAHAMWQVAYRHENMLKTACQYSAMFSHLKLQMLAKLNFLPSWWFLRETATSVMNGYRWNVDDEEMMTLWNTTREWCITMRKVSMGNAMRGDRVDGVESDENDAKYPHDQSEG